MEFDYGDRSIPLYLSSQLSSYENLTGRVTFKAKNGDDERVNYAFPSNLIGDYTSARGDTYISNIYLNKSGKYSYYFVKLNNKIRATIDYGNEDNSDQSVTFTARGQDGYEHSYTGTGKKIRTYCELQFFIDQELPYDVIIAIACNSNVQTYPSESWHDEKNTEYGAFYNYYTSDHNYENNATTDKGNAYSNTWRSETDKEDDGNTKGWGLSNDGELFGALAYIKANEKKSEKVTLYSSQYSYCAWASKTYSYTNNNPNKEDKYFNPNKKIDNFYAWPKHQGNRGLQTNGNVSLTLYIYGIEADAKNENFTCSRYWSDSSDSGTPSSSKYPFLSSTTAHYSQYRLMWAGKPRRHNCTFASWVTRTSTDGTDANRYYILSTIGTAMSVFSRNSAGVYPTVNYKPNVPKCNGKMVSISISGSVSSPSFNLNSSETVETIGSGTTVTYKHSYSFSTTLSNCDKQNICTKKEITDQGLSDKGTNVLKDWS